MTEEAQRELADLQRQILSVVWRYVKPGGYLLFSTCTINTGENEENTRWLWEQFPLAPVEIAGWLGELTGSAQESGLAPLSVDVQGNSLQLLPGIHDSDGFFVSVFRRCGE